MKKVFCISLLISIWLVILFWGKNIGLSMLLFIGPFLYFLITFLEENNKIKYKKSKILIIPITLLASTYFVFNNSFFNTLNLIVIPVLIILMIIEFFENKLNIDKIFIRSMELLIDPLTYVETIFKDLKKCIASSFKLKRNEEKENNLLKGIAVTIPVLIIIILLLSSADEIFESIFVEFFKSISILTGKFELKDISFKVAVIIILFTYFSSFFKYLIFEFEGDNEEYKKMKISEITTMKMILVALNVTYILFCIIQIRALFMGKEDVVNYSQYARKGFFQLMIVSFINLVVILIAKTNEKSKFINSMCLVMIGCTFIILLSSAYRMFLYESAYGYTRLRLLVYVALLTEAILLVPTIIYVLDKKINLRTVYLSIIICMYVGVNFANIDNIITKSNVDRYFNTGVFDVEYLRKETGTDAMQQLIRIRDSEAKTEEESEIKYNVTLYLAEMYQNLESDKMDFRDLNLSKIIAKYIY